MIILSLMSDFPLDEDLIFIFFCCYCFFLHTPFHTIKFWRQILGWKGKKVQGVFHWGIPYLNHGQIDLTETVRSILLRFNISTVFFKHIMFFQIAVTHINSSVI